MPANYVLLERIELNASAASVTFANIPQTGYTDLKVVISANCTTADDVRIRFNGNTSASYSMRSINGSGSAVSSASESAQTSSWCGNFTGAGSTYNNAEIYIPNYLSTSSAKSTSVDNVSEANTTLTPLRLIAQLWNPSSQAAITSILLYPSTHSWSVNSTFSLYGLAALGTTPTVAPKASGGNVIATDGTYWYHAFLASGTFTPQVGLTADCLVVAGGGGGGSGNNPGGGGAGGLLAFISQSLASGTGYTCTVGAGGATGNPSGVNGNDSQFSSLTLVKGGGYGAGTNNTSGVHNVGGTGGSGGGSSFGYTASGGSATSGQGFAGGAGEGVIAPNYYGGGGGGAGETGNTDGQGDGGDGSSTYSSWGSATTTGENVSGTYFYAGGGGGSGQNTSTSKTGGSGGGGRGGGTLSAVAGTANTGGGGGSAGNSAGNVGTAGGSGIVIIRYLAI